MKGARARDGQPNFTQADRGCGCIRICLCRWPWVPITCQDPCPRSIDRIESIRVDVWGSASLNSCITVSVAFTWGGACVDCGPWKRRRGLDQSISVIEIARDGREMGIWGGLDRHYCVSRPCFGVALKTMQAGRVRPMYTRTQKAFAPITLTLDSPANTRR